MRAVAALHLIGTQSALIGTTSGLTAAAPPRWRLRYLERASSHTMPSTVNWTTIFPGHPTRGEFVAKML
jgi:hypothetical protein